MRKKAYAFMAVLLAASFLSGGCGSAKDASEYVRAVLDERLQGEFTEASEIMGVSEYELSRDYEESVDQFVYSYFTAGYEELNDYTLYEYGTLIKEIFNVMKYDVEEAKKEEKNEYEVSVVIRPVDLFLNYTKDLQEAAAEIEKSAENGGYVGSDEEKSEMMQYDYLARSVELLKDSYLKMQYSDPETVLLKVSYETGKGFCIEEEEYGKLLEQFFRMDELGNVN